METLKAQKEQKIQSKKNNSIFFKPVIQKKLSVGSANDSYEVEADQVADKVMKMSEPASNITHSGALVQRKCAHCEQEEKLQMKPLAESISPLIQRSSPESGRESHAPNHVENQINSSKGSGNSMDKGTKNFMESRFGTDFSNVKIHTGSDAVQMSRELGAQAFVVGNDIYFNEGKYNPNSDSGKHLLAHELTHTVQQVGGIGRKIQKRCGRRSQTNPRFPNTFISRVNVNLTRQDLSIVWSPSIPAMHRGLPVRIPISSGAGLCSLADCNNTGRSTTPRSACTPIGTFSVNNVSDCTLSGHSGARFPTRFSRSGIAIHAGGGLGSPRSHGCVRTQLNVAQIIQENSIVGRTNISVSGRNRRSVCYSSLSDENPVSIPRRRTERRRGRRR